MTKKDLKSALKEASWWNLQLTEYEKSEIFYDEARKRVLKRIFEKYKNSL